MITRCQITFSVGGLGFNPVGHDLPWEECDPCEIPEGWGYAKVYREVPGLAEQEEVIHFLHQAFLPQLSALRQSGASEFDLFITWTYDSQCSGSFSAEEFRWIAELECSLALDARAEF